MTNDRDWEELEKLSRRRPSVSGYCKIHNTYVGSDIKGEMVAFSGLDEFDNTATRGKEEKEDQLSDNENKK